MKGFPQVIFSIFVIFLGALMDSVSRCDARRRLSVVGTNSIKALFACEDQIMHLSCPHRLLSVQILSAKYGRLLSKKNICSPTSERQVIKDCGESNVKKNIDALCVGKTECSFDVDDRNLGAFCVNVYKYLNVIFKCVVKPTTLEPPTTTPMPTTVPPTTTSLTQSNTNLTSTNITDNSTSQLDNSIQLTEATQKATKVSARPSKPDLEVYNRDVFSRRNDATSTLSSGLHSTCKFAVSLSVFVVFDAYIFRVT